MKGADIKAMLEEVKYYISFDADGNQLEGDKNYKLHLPQDIPASNFWSVIVYDTQTHLMIQTDQKWPSVHSNCRKLLINPDGSVYVWFGPNAPAGKENNWVKTIPGKGWNMILRLYDPMEQLFNMTWKPGEIDVLR